MNTTVNIATRLQTMLEEQRQAFLREPYPDWDRRAAWLKALRSLIVENQPEICAAIGQDFGCRSPAEVRALEMFPSLDGIKHALKHGRRWMRSKRRFASMWFLPARTEMVPQPLGVVGVIVPWNYPLFLAMGPITDALAAGNRVMVKMSEFTPRFSELFAELMHRYFPDDQVQVVTGDVEVAQAFSALPFNHILFTGSTSVGRHIMRAAADNLTPVTLELGGKSPGIIGPNARFEHAVERIVYGKCVNAGQTCIAPDYVLLPAASQQKFIDMARETFRRMYPDFANKGQYTSVITDRQYERLLGLRDAAVAAGAVAHPLADGEPEGSLRRLSPTLLTNVSPDSRVMQDEIFGPLLPLVPYDTIDDALQFIAERPHPLALYLFEENKAVQRKVLQRSQAGGVSINDTLYHITQHHLPFGGVGESGMGAYHGEEGFRTFSRMKPVFHQSRFSGTFVFNPPYGKRFQRMVDLVLRH